MQTQSLYLENIRPVIKPILGSFLEVSLLPSRDSLGKKTQISALSLGSPNIPQGLGVPSLTIAPHPPSCMCSVIFGHLWQQCH